MISSYFLLTLVCTSLGAGNASEAGKCAPGDASCRGLSDEEVLLQSVMIHEVDAEEQDSCGTYKDPLKCPAPNCEWIDHVCQTPCYLFKNANGDNCPARCDWNQGKCKEHGTDLSSNAAFTGPPEPTTESASVHKSMEKKFGPGADLILALPLVLQNLTKYSNLISLASDPEAKKASVTRHVFGDADSDKEFLLDQVAGFFATLHADSHAKATGVTAKCPKNDITVIKPCVEMSLCEVQTHLDANPKIKKTYMTTYALLEQLAAGFADINYGILDHALKTEDPAFPEYTSHSEYSTHMSSYDTYLEPSQFACKKKTALAQEDDSNEHTAVRAAAYHTSEVLQAAAKVAHTVLDLHTHNSSAEATLEALHQAFKPSCELLNCDHTNYFDLFGASHSHSLALIEADASAQHMRTHIRTRNRLDVRMNRFLSEHGTQFLKDGKLALYRTEGTTTEATMEHYYSGLRGDIMSFAASHSKTKMEDELMVVIGKQRMSRDHEERRALEDGSQGEFHGNDGPETEIDEEHQNDQLDDSELDTGLSEIAEEDAVAGRRRRRWLRRRRRRWFIQKAVKAVVKAVNTAWKFIMSTFACIGKTALMAAGGYGQKYFSEGATAGFGIAFSMSDSISSLGTFLRGQMVRSISFSVGFVCPFVPYGAIAGGVRSGVGIAGSIGCGTTGCSVGISVGSVVAGLIPTEDPKCVVGKYLNGTPPNGWTCFISVSVAVSLMCCTHNFFTGSSNCR